MLFNNYLGSNNVKESLSAAIASGWLSHGLILNAQKGCGVNYFAKLLAGTILNLDIDDLYSSPQCIIVQGEGASGQIKVEAIRNVNQEVSFSMVNAEKRVVIIENCENFNNNSANALLKNLEEPKNDTTYILTTNDLTKILPTIRSRCGVYTLSNPSSLEIDGYFKEYEQNKYHTIKNIYGENIGFIKQALEDNDRYDILSKATMAYDLILSKDKYELSVLLFEYNKNKPKFILFLQDLEMISKQNINQDTIIILDIILKYNQFLKTNASLSLLIQNFVCEIIK